MPRKTIEYKGALFEEMDVDAILARKPGVVLVDELAHTNIEGSKHRKRYEDVLELLDAGIDVLSTMNIQHLESVTPTVQGVTGIQVRETVPDWVLQRVNEVVMIDLTPEALQNRMRRGDVYPQERWGGRWRIFSARQPDRIARAGIAPGGATGGSSLEQHMEEKDTGAWAVRERIAVCISSNPAAQYLVARGARMAQADERRALCGARGPGTRWRRERRRKITDLQSAVCRKSGSEAGTAEGRACGGGDGAVLREKHITHVIFGRSATEGWRKLLYMNAINRFLNEAPAVDVHIVTRDAD